MTGQPIPHPEALEATVEHLAEIIRRHISLDPAQFRASSVDAAWAIMTEAAFASESGERP